MLTKLQFKPGINREVSDYTNEQGWSDCNNIRFRYGFPEKIGGWDQYTTNTLTGTCRSLHPWVALDGSKFLGCGTHLKYYIEQGGGLNDITPIRYTSAVGDVTFSATAGSSIITVSDNGNGSVENDFVSFYDAVGLGSGIGGATPSGTSTGSATFTGVTQDSTSGVGTGAEFTITADGAGNYTLDAITANGANYAVSDTITVTGDNLGGATPANDLTLTIDSLVAGSITADILNDEHQIVEVLTANSYTIDVGTAADANDVGDGGTSAYGAYQVNTGLDTTVGGNGFGAGSWSRGTWGSSTPLTAVSDVLRIWNHDNFGEDLVFNVLDGGIYYWDRSESGLTFERGVELSQLGLVYNSVAASQTPGGAGNLTLTSSPVIFDFARYVNITGANDESGVTFTITGLDKGGESQTEVISGPNNGTVVTLNPFLRVTQIAVDGATTGAIEVGEQIADGYVPTIARKVIVSDRDRHLLAFGADPFDNIGTQDPLLIRFSAQENVGEWLPNVDNTAGDLRISTGSKIVTAIETRQQILVWTDVSLHAMQYLGPPFTFGIDQISNNTTIMSPNAAVPVDDNVFWMGIEGFYQFSGAVNRIPCTVKSYVFDNLNYLQREKIFAGVNSSFNEVWWFYPSAGSDDVDSYVIYNYQQQVWYYGSLRRTAWVDLGIAEFPVAAEGSELYTHESGVDANGVAMDAFIESSTVDINDGQQFAFIRRLIPDLKFTGTTAESPQVDFVLKTRNFPGSAFGDTETSTVARTATVPVTQFTDQKHVRLRGRSVALRIENANQGTQWRLGTPRIDVRADGDR